MLPALARRLLRADERRAAARVRVSDWRRRVGDAMPRAGHALRAVVSGVVAVVVLVAGVVAVTTQRGAPRRPVAAVAGPELGADRGPVLGPAPGQPVGSYLAAAAGRLRDLVLAHPGRDTLALVSFGTEVSPAVAGRLVAPLRSSTAYADAGAGGLAGLPGGAATGLRAVAATGDVARTAPQGLRAIARQLLAAAAELEQLAGRAAPGQPTLVEQQVAQRRLARGYRQQAARLLRADCLVGVLVHGTGAQLAEVAHRAGVRAVDPAPAGVPVGRLDVRPLLPAAARG